MGRAQGLSDLPVPAAIGSGLHSWRQHVAERRAILHTADETPEFKIAWACSNPLIDVVSLRKLEVLALDRSYESRVAPPLPDKP